MRGTARFKIAASVVSRSVSAFVACAVVAVLASCNATLPAAPSSPPVVTSFDIIYSSPTQLPLFTGTTVSLRAFEGNSAELFRDLSAAASWVSSAPAVLDRSAGSTFRAIGPGQAVVTATAEGRVASTTITVTSSPRPYPYLDVRPFLSPRVPGATGTISVLLVRSPSSFEEVTRTAAYASSNPNVASVAQGGEVTAHRIGTTEISVSHSGLVGVYRLSPQP